MRGSSTLDTTLRGHNDNGGSAARFFYTAKASRAERNAGCEGMEEKAREGQSAWAGCCNVCGCRMMLNSKPTCGHDDFEWVTCRPTQNHHPTVKPLALMRYLAKLTRTPTGGIVLDPFAGSGSTGVACIQTGRSFIGIELDPGYLEIAAARIQHAINEVDQPQQMTMEIL